MKTAKSEPRFWRVRYTVVAILLAGWMFSFLDRMIMGVALPYIGDEFHLSNEQKGLILSAFFLGYALFQIPGGLIADRFGPRRVMSAAIAWWSIFTSLTGFMTVLPALLLIRFVFGLGEAAFPAASWKTVALYFPPRERATATSVMAIVNALGPAVATAIAAGIINTFGWRAVFICLGIPGIVISSAIFFFVADNPRIHPKISSEELNQIDSDERDTTVSDKTKTKLTSYSDLMRQPILWQLVMMWFFFDITYWGFVSWLPSYLVKGRNFSLEELGTYGSLPFFLGAISLILGGMLSDKLKDYGIHRKWLFVPTSIAASISLYFTYALTSFSGTVAAQCIASIFMFLGFAAFWGLVVDAIPPAIMGAGSATVNFGGQVAGILAAWAIGRLIDLNNGSYEWAFWFLMAGTSVSAIIALSIKSRPSTFVQGQLA